MRSVCSTALSLVLLAVGSSGSWATTTVTTQPCSDVSDCYDGNSCTTDACVGNVCTYTDDTLCGSFLDFPVEGKKVKLIFPPANPSANAFKLLATGGQLDYAIHNNLPDPSVGGEYSGNPLLSGGSLRIFTTSGDGFDHTYPLPSANASDPTIRHWENYPLNRPGLNGGFQYKDGSRLESPIRGVKIVAGKTVKVKGKYNMPFSLTTNPDPVQVVLMLGRHRYCWSMGLVGGDPDLTRAFFATNKIYWAKNTPPPAACP